jgi:hypothetical protein
LDGNFKGLFDTEDDGGGQEPFGSRKGGSKFIEYFGWQYCTKIVADFHNIKYNEGYELGTIEYLNTLSYLKAERDFKK